MRNRAKCKLCSSVIESFHRYDWVTCKCGEISIAGGLDYLKCGAKNWNNFLRIDDLGNEMVVKLVEGEENIQLPEEKTQVSKTEMLEMLDQLIKDYENLPQHVMTLPITHYDFYSFMLLIASIVKQ